MEATYDSYVDAKAAFARLPRVEEDGWYIGANGLKFPTTYIAPLLHLVVNPSVDDVKAAIADRIRNFEAIPTQMLEDRELALYVANHVFERKEYIKKMIPRLDYNEELFTKAIGCYPELITSIENASESLKAYAERVKADHYQKFMDAWDVRR